LGESQFNANGVNGVNYRRNFSRGTNDPKCIIYPEVEFPSEAEKRSGVYQVVVERLCDKNRRSDV
jgi:hypothetical protein